MSLKLISTFQDTLNIGGMTTGISGAKKRE